MSALKFFFTSRSALAFCARAGVLLILLGSFSLTGIFARHIMLPLKNLDAALTHQALLVLGYDTSFERASSPNNPHVLGSAFNIEIIDECTGISVMIILLALTLAFPASIKARLAGIFLGIAMIFSLNMVRLVSLYAIGVHYPDLFHDTHIFVWQGVFIIITFIYWYVWAQRTGSTKLAAENTGASPT